MNRKIENCNNNILVRLLNNIYLGIYSMINDYSYLYNNDEIERFKEYLEKALIVINDVKDNKVKYSDIYEILSYEKELKPFIFRCWNHEYESGNKYISWFKYDKLGDMPKVLSVTFGDGESFCGSRYGISYEVSLDGFLGACEKDAASLIEDEGKQSIYTIGFDKDNKVINSYNLATPIITPKQVFDKSKNTYMSHHNEILLDSRYIRPVSVVYMDDNDLEMVNLISEKYNIPIEFQKKGYKK